LKYLNIPLILLQYLKPSDALVLSQLVFLKKRYEKIFVSNKWLSDTLHLSEKTIKRAIKYLSDNNYITCYYDNQDKIKSKRFIFVSKTVLSMVSNYTTKTVKIIRKGKSNVLKAFLNGNYESC